MNRPVVYNLTRYDTEDLCAIVNKTYELLAQFGGSSSREDHLQFREHGVTRQGYSPADVLGSRSTYKYLVSYPMSMTRRHHVRLLRPEKLHDSNLSVLASMSGADETLPCAPEEMAPWIIAYIIETVERVGLSDATRGIIRREAASLPLRYNVNKRPKTPTVVRDLERARVEKELWDGLRYDSALLRNKAISMTNKFKKMQQRYTQMGVEPMQPDWVEEFTRLLDRVEVHTYRVSVTKEPIR